jgi:hypothetical protein
MNVSGLSCILTTHQPRTKLTNRHQKIHIVGPNKVLGHAYDGGIQRCLTVVIARMLGNISCELSNSKFGFQIPLESRV